MVWQAHIVTQIRNKSVSSSDVANSLNKATSSDNVVEAYKNSLQNKFGCPIKVASVGKDQETFLVLCICIALKDIHRILKKTVLLC